MVLVCTARVVRLQHFDGVLLFNPCLFLRLATHSKTPFNLSLTGITNDNVDLSVDALKAVTLPLLKHFGAGEDGGLELKVRMLQDSLHLCTMLRFLFPLDACGTLPIYVCPTLG